MTDTALILKENLTELALFTTEKSVTQVLTQIEKLAALDTVYDMTCPKGRKACASMAYRIARTKTLLDGYGKDLVAPRKAELASIDSRRKVLKDALTEMQKTVRAPLDEHELKEKAEAEKKRVAMNERLRTLADMNFNFSLNDIPAELGRIASSQVTTDVYGEQVAYAQGLKDKAIQELTAALQTPAAEPAQEVVIDAPAEVRTDQTIPTAEEHQVQVEARKGVLRGAEAVDQPATFDETLDAIQKHCSCSRMKARNLLAAINEDHVPFLQVVV